MKTMLISLFSLLTRVELWDQLQMKEEGSLIWSQMLLSLSLPAKSEAAFWIYTIRAGLHHHWVSLCLKHCFPRWDWALPSLGWAETMLPAMVTAELIKQLPKVRLAPETKFLTLLPTLKTQGELIVPIWSGHSHRDTRADPSPALSLSCSLHNPSTAAQAAAQQKQTEELIWAKNRALYK